MITSFLVFLIFVQLACCSGPSDWPLLCGSELTSHKNWRLLNSGDNCGVTGEVISVRTLGGRMAAEREFPWMVMLLYFHENEQYIFRCGGAIISDRYILTAAHCIVGEKLNRPSSAAEELMITSRTFIRVGGFDKSNLSDCFEKNCRAKNIAIDSFITHGRYNNFTFENDIALIRLKEKIQFDDYKQPICLPTSCDLVNKNFDGTNLVLAGWGLNDRRGKLLHDGPLRKVKVVATSSEDCWKWWFPDLNIRRSQICTWGSTPWGGVVGAYSGDSGSPLVYKDFSATGPGVRHFAIGVTSFVVGGNPEEGLEIWLEKYRRRPPVYARVAAYMTWIMDRIYSEEDEQ